VGGDHPTFRVRGRNFVFCDQTATHLTVKLPRQEAEAVVATDPRVAPAGYGLGRSGWITVTLDEPLDASSWREIEEWVRTSYTLVAPNALGRRAIERDAARADSAASENVEPRIPALTTLSGPGGVDDSGVKVCTTGMP
jgi:predicted DNA-binding protein (MmcQ/YjbR family)